MSRNLDLRQDFRVGWHSKSSLQVWWWSEVSRCPPQPVDEPHRRPDELHPPLSEPHRECADAIFWYLESSDHHQTYRNYSKYYHTPISSLRSGFWNVRRFFTSWLLNLSLALKGELFQILRNTLNWSLVEGIWKSQSRSKIYQDDHLCEFGTDRGTLGCSLNVMMNPIWPHQPVDEPPMSFIHRSVSLTESARMQSFGI